MNHGVFIGGAIGLLIGGIVVQLIGAYLTDTRCPNCHRYFVTATEMGERIGSEVQTVEEQRTVQTMDRRGLTILFTKVPFQKHQIVDKYLVHCHCRNCSHDWERATSRVRQP